jgi:2-polyprenyl-3-methyl-5-hydroxy-6-metoxy-1,4-benzoquinol methylase
MSKYRARIYQHYVDAWEKASKPKSVSDFASRAPTMLHVIGAFFPKDKAAVILDLGCGHGTLLHFVHKSGYRNAKGIDASSQQVALAADLGIQNVEAGDLLVALESVAADSVDVVVAFDVIEHFTKDELIDFVDAVRRVLRPGGRWIIHAPNGASPFVGAVRYGDLTHEQAFTSQSLQQLFVASGFSASHFSECGPRVHGLKSLIRVALWKFVRIVFILMQAAETGELSRKVILTRNLYAVAYK